MPDLVLPDRLRLADFEHRSTVALLPSSPLYMSGPTSWTAAFPPQSKRPGCVGQPVAGRHVNRP